MAELRRGRVELNRSVDTALGCYFAGQCLEHRADLVADRRPVADAGNHNLHVATSPVAISR